MQQLLDAIEIGLLCQLFGCSSIGLRGADAICVNDLKRQVKISNCQIFCHLHSSFYHRRWTSEKLCLVPSRTSVGNYLCTLTYIKHSRGVSQRMKRVKRSKSKPIQQRNCALRCLPRIEMLTFSRFSAIVLLMAAAVESKSRDCALLKVLPASLCPVGGKSGNSCRLARVSASGGGGTFWAVALAVWELRRTEAWRDILVSKDVTSEVESLIFASFDPCSPITVGLLSYDTSLGR